MSREVDETLRAESLAQTKLSNERTLAAWLRTGLAVAVVGLAVMRFLVEQEHPLEPWFRLGGAGFVLVGVLLLVFAAFDYRRTHRAIKETAYHSPKRLLVAVVALVALLLLGVLVLLAIS